MFDAQQTFCVADDFKEIGNNEFRQGDYKLALEYYEYVTIILDTY